MNDIADFVRQQGLLTERGNASAGGVTLMGKVRVNGEEADPIWKVRPQQPRSLMPPPPPPPRQLIVLPALPLVQLARSAFPGEVTWNFAGIFLFDAAGLCVGRFDLDGDTVDVDDLLGVIVMRRRACVKGIPFTMDCCGVGDNAAKLVSKQIAKQVRLAFKGPEVPAQRGR